MTSFRMAFHATSSRRIVEVYGDGGQLLGVMYPTEDGSNSVHLVSKYEIEVVIMPPSAVPVPSKRIKFGHLIDGTGARSQEPSEE